MRLDRLPNIHFAFTAKARTVKARTVKARTVKARLVACVLLAACLPFHAASADDCISVYDTGFFPARTRVESVYPFAPVRPAQFKVTDPSGREHKLSVSQAFEVARFDLSDDMKLKVLTAGRSFSVDLSIYLENKIKPAGPLVREPLTLDDALSWLYLLNTLSTLNDPVLTEIIPDHIKGTQYHYATESELILAGQQSLASISSAEKDQAVALTRVIFEKRQDNMTSGKMQSRWFFRSIDRFDERSGTDSVAPKVATVLRLVRSK